MATDKDNLYWPLERWQELFARVSQWMQSAPPGTYSITDERVRRVIMDELDRIGTRDWTFSNDYTRITRHQD